MVRTLFVLVFSFGWGWMVADVCYWRYTDQLERQVAHAERAVEVAQRACQARIAEVRP